MDPALFSHHYLFKHIDDYNNKREKKTIKISDILEVCVKHFHLLKENREERVCVNLTKKHFSWYLKGFDNASSWRKKILFSKDISEIEDTIDNMKKELI